MVIKAADEFTDKTTAIDVADRLSLQDHRLRLVLSQHDLDDYSRYIMPGNSAPTFEDVTATIELALAAGR